MLELRNISKKYRKDSGTFIALDKVSLTIGKGDFVAVIGASGSGKSTLLNAAGGLIHPDGGNVVFKEMDLYGAGRKDQDEYRKNTVGFVFQQFHLVPYLTVKENIALACRNPLYINKIDAYLDKCSLSEQKNKFPSELSVGEKQRTAFIRAIIHSPEILLADEPTGNLDPANSLVLLNMIMDFHQSGGTVILVSHDSSVSRFATRTVTLEKGKIVKPDS